MYIRWNFIEMELREKKISFKGCTKMLGIGTVTFNRYRTSVSDISVKLNNFVNATNKEPGCSKEYSAQKINNRDLGIKGIKAKFIQPNKDYKDVNDDGLVLFIDYNNTELLFTGDLSTESESDMVNNKLVPDVDILKVAHHGSKYATSTNFLKKSTPQYSIISVGQNNYGHPNGDVLNRLKTAKSTVYRTDQNGNIVMNTDGNKISFTTSKASRPTPITPSTPISKTVYITKTGTKYHYNKNCRGLSNANAIYTSTLTEAKNKGLTLCGYED